MCTYVYALCGASELYQRNVLPSILLNNFLNFPTNYLALIYIFTFQFEGGGGHIVRIVVCFTLWLTVSKILTTTCLIQFLATVGIFALIKPN